MPQLFANNAVSSLNGGIVAETLAITLAAGEGARFPTPAGGDYFLVTLFQKPAGIEINHEVVKCTARAGDVLTVARGQEGTTPLAFNNADPVELRVTAGSMNAKLDKSGGTLAGTLTGADNVVAQAMLKDVGYAGIDKGNSGTATQTFDYRDGSKQKVTATGAHTFAFSNWPPTGNEGIMRVDFVNYGAFTITPPAVTWTNPDGSETTSLVTHFAALAAAGGRAGFTAAGLTKAIFWCDTAGATVYGRFI